MIIKNPNTGRNMQINTHSISDANNTIEALKENTSWALTTVHQRTAMLKRFRQLLKKNRDQCQDAISKDTGKPRWESLTEVDAAIHKLDATLMAYDYRMNYPDHQSPQKIIQTLHKPLGCVAVIGPFNFPLHIPNGQILPALLSGNTVVVKPSEYSPTISKLTEKLWQMAAQNTPTPIRFVYGDKVIGKHIVNHAKIDGVFFTGSSHAGLVIERACLKKRIPCALEMGGNNALIVEDATDDIINHLTMSAFITAGQRCSCARRVIINRKHEWIIDEWVKAVKQLSINPYPKNDNSFMGPVVLPNVKYELLTKKFNHTTPLLPAKDIGAGGLVQPRIELCAGPLDKELFGPMAMIMLSDSFEESLSLANQSGYGLSCSIYTQSKKKFQHAFHTIEAGIINWNTPTTGASAYAPFGGVKNSGNFRPGGFSMIDHCAIPIASTQSNHIHPIAIKGMHA
jgi:succinylglutamic semialdehyde dehydrogenase